MAHDFGETRDQPRYSSLNEDCLHSKGYMSYDSNPKKWSPCSVEDFTAYFRTVDNWCLSTRKITLKLNMLKCELYILLKMCSIIKWHLFFEIGDDGSLSATKATVDILTGSIQISKL